MMRPIAVVGGGTGRVWYDGVTGILAGNALVTVQRAGCYAGPIWFFERSGNATGWGATTVTFP